VKYLKDDVNVKALDALTGVHGIGPKTALKFISQGILTIEDLRKNQDKLSSV